MEKKYTKKQINEIVDRAINIAMDNHQKHLEKATEDENGKYDSHFVMANLMQVMLVLADFKSNLWEDE